MALLLRSLFASFHFGIQNKLIYQFQYFYTISMSLKSYTDNAVNILCLL